MAKLHLAWFNVDATTPLGHPLCGGWIKPATAVTEPLEARGVVLLGNEAPVTLLAIDWTGVCNASYDRIRADIARAVHSTPERVLVHAVHQHNAPFIDETGQDIVREAEKLAPICNVDWSHQIFGRIAESARASLSRTVPITRIGTGSAVVERVASNRRLVDATGKLIGWRGSSCKDADLRARPDGLIDPALRTLSFWSDEKAVAALHFYAVHPMSYYGDGLVTSDFVGLARAAVEKESGVPQLYFTGCAGNIAAGKYNDGERANRFLLAKRMFDAMARSLKDTAQSTVDGFSLRTVDVSLPPRSDQTETELRSIVHDPKAAHATRSRAAMKLAYRLRAEAGAKISLARLAFEDRASVATFPAESFIEYQIEANRLANGRFIACAAYGEGGPWYVPTRSAYPEGGYEPSASFVDPDSETVLRSALQRLFANDSR